MPDSITPPDITDQLAELDARVANLERRLDLGGNGRVRNEITFSYAGPLQDDTESPPIKSRYSHALITVNFMLGTSGASDTIVQVRRNGISVRTVTIPAGALEKLAVVDVDIGKDQDVITMYIQTAGSGAADMSGQCRFS